MSILCEITVENDQRHELLLAYCEACNKRAKRPSLAIDMLAHNVRHQYLVPIYVSHLGDVLQFALDFNLEWLERQLAHEYGLLRERRKAARESVASQEPTPCSGRSETEAE